MTAALVVGPILRNVTERSATVWMETSESCEVDVLGRTEQTFTVHGHHYALVDVEGLEPGGSTPYEVLLDGRKVWPQPGSEFPASVIRTVDPALAPQVAFGSCRVSPASQETHGVDALSAFAHELKNGAEPPTALAMIGDQVYADATGERMRDFIRGRRDINSGAGEEIADFEEYTELYRLAWMTDPAVRWLFSTVPVYSIFDDHDVRDDWNTSYVWRKWVAEQTWWKSRIVGGLSSYWIYQHLGNLTPDKRRADPLYQRIKEAEDGGEILDAFAEQADLDPATARWSFRVDLAGTRLLFVDSRASRLLTETRRAILDDDEQAWLDEQLTGGVDQLLIASSLPFLLPPVIHHAEAWNEKIAAGGRKKDHTRNGFGEKIRQAIDLEHWAAFGDSFTAVAEAVTEVANGRRGTPPAHISFLGGDVHYSYFARVKGLPINQIVCSPFRNPLGAHFQWANRLAAMVWGNLPARLIAKTARVPRPPLRWRLTDGPWFANAIATVGRDEVVWRTPSGPTALTELHRTPLAP